MRRGPYRRAAANSATSSRTAAAGSDASAAARTSREPTITPSAPARGRRGRAPRACRCRTRARPARRSGAFVRARIAARSPASAPALPGRARDRDGVDEAARAARRSRRAVASGVVGATSGDERDARRVAGGQRSPASSSGRSGTIRPLMPRCARSSAKRSDTAREHEVRVAHEHDRDGVRERLPDLQDAVHGGAGRERLGPGRVDHRAVRERVGERHAQLDEVGAGLGVGLADRARRREVGEAAHQVRHQRRAACPDAANAAAIVSCPAATAHAGRSSTSARSLSPRPERQTSSSASRLRRGSRAPRRRRGRTRAPG